MAIGVYNQKCLWQKKGTTRNKRNEIVETEPIELPCSRYGKEELVIDTNGKKYVYKLYYNFEDDRVKKGDLIDGKIVTSTPAERGQEGKGFGGEFLTWQVVVDNA